MIPKILHHIGPEDKSVWHPFWERCQDSWIRSFPHYDYMFWNDSEDIDQLVRDHYPRYWNLYRSFPVHIMRIDFARLCILHRYGGLYSDLDYYCYSNFDEDLKKGDHDVYLVENLTEEFTEASVENSLMASEQGSGFLTDTMGYVQACFIEFRNRLNKIKGPNWMDSESRFLVNNTTGSGMLTMARESYGRAVYNVGHFNTSEFNNRPASYFDSMKAKHVHTTVWGNDQISTNYDDRRILIADGNMHTMDTIPDYAIDRLDSDKDYVLDFDSFDFYTDYTHGKYLPGEQNVEQTIRWIRDSEKRTASIMRKPTDQ